MKEALYWCAGLIAVIFLVVYVGGAVISAQPRAWTTDAVIGDVPAGTPSAELDLTIRFQPTCLRRDGHGGYTRCRTGWGPSGGLLPDGYEWGMMPTLRAEVRAVGLGSQATLTEECNTGYTRTDHEPGTATHLRDRIPVCEWRTHVRIYNHTTQLEVRILQHRYTGWETVMSRLQDLYPEGGNLFDRSRLDLGRQHQHVAGDTILGFYWIRAEDLRPNP